MNNEPEVTAERLLFGTLNDAILHFDGEGCSETVIALKKARDYFLSLQARNKELEAENTRLRAIIEAEPKHCGWCSEGKDGKCEGLLVVHYPKP